MLVRNARLMLIVKLLLAATAIVAIVAVAVRQMVPTLPTRELLLYCAGGGLAVFLLVILAAVCSLQFSQFILRHGGTDAQWFWFSGEPEGLAALRRGQAVDGKRQA